MQNSIDIIFMKIKTKDDNMENIVREKRCK